MKKLRFQSISWRQKTSLLRKIVVGNLFCHLCRITKQFVRNKGWLGDILGQFTVSQPTLSILLLLTLETGEFTGSSRASFPYILAAKDGQTIYSPESVPADFCLGDPDHLKSLDIHTLYNHWLRRQQKGLRPFIILNASPLHSTCPLGAYKASKIIWEG